MGFFLQLRMLLWKNFLLRKRQKKRLIVELIWPLFLFLILMWVRTRGLRTNKQECHFTPKAMPSMGQFPFIQSFICTFNNTCHKTVKETEVDGSRFNSLTTIQFLSHIRAVFASPRVTREAQTMQSVTADLQDLVSVVRNIANRENVTEQGAISVRELINNRDSIVRNIEDRNISLDRSVLDMLLDSTIHLNRITPQHVMLFSWNYSSVLCNEELLNNIITTKNGEPVPADQLCVLQSNEIEELVKIVRDEVTISLRQLSDYVQRNASRNVLWQDWSRLQSLSNQMARNINNLQAQSEMISGVTATGEEYRNLMYALNEQNATQFEQAVIIVNRFLCGNESDNLMDQLLGTGGEANRFDSLSDQFKDTKLVQPAYIYDNTTTKQCNDMIERLESSPGTRIFWRMIKPFVRGKILYTPERTVTKRIMDRVNQAFYPVKMLHNLTLTLANVTLPLLKEMLVNNSENLRIVREFYESPAGQEILNNTLLRNLLGDNYDKDIEQARRDIEMFLDVNNTEYRLETFQYLIDAQYNVSEILECFDWDKAQGYSSEEEGMKAGMQLLENNKLWALVVFENSGNDTHFSPNVTYKIRMNTERVDNTEQLQDVLWRQGARIRPAIDLKYITYGFAYLQDMLDHNIIREQTGRNELPGIQLQQFPYPCYISDEFVMAISRTFPLFMVLSWVYTCSMIVKSIVYEKEERLKETMRVMGLGNGIHWLGWFIDSLLPMLVTIFLLTVILVYGNVLQKADPTLVFCFLTVYGISTIAQAFLISVFFSKANISAASGGIIFFVLYLPYPFMVRWMVYLSSGTKAIMSLSSNVAFGLGASYLSLYEEQGTGIGWGDIWQSPLVNDTFCLAYVMFMLMLDALIYFILTWYIEAVFPGQYGIPKPWYFPVTRSYWCGTEKRKNNRESTDQLIGSENDNEENFEKDPIKLLCGVAIRNLGMVYTNGKVAVKNLNINFYEDQITSFLGHNGAGKTTTISILTGLFPPSFGTANIYGLDIRSDMDTIRTSLGMCPQHNVLFHLLSVEEHLWFYARLRGQPEEKVKAESDIMIQDLGLPHKRTTVAKDLSGGMQRKLSVAIAFIGGSKTVILDEPTSGVDPYSRRSIWDLLIKYKKGRTVILTTHYMDEADFLGDRIAIIANGQLQCCGTSVFLKSQFGSGYYLTVELDTSEDTGNPEQQDTTNHELQALTNCVNQAMPSAKFLERIGGELIYVLPERDNLVAFTTLFDSLDANKDKLSIHSYGISDTSLEEIFLRVAERGEKMAAVGDIIDVTNNSFLDSLRKYLSHKDVKPAVHSNGVEPQIEKEIVIRRNGASVKYTTVAMQEDGEVPVTSSNKYWRQFMALHIKRFHHTRRNKKALFSELVIPALFVCMSLIVTSILPKLRERPPLLVSPWIYNAPRYMFFSNESTVDPWVSDYTQEIVGPNGLGTVCLYRDDGTRNEFCSMDDVVWPALSKTNSSSFGPDCSCSTGSQVCPVGAGKPDPPSSKIISGDTMFNVTGRNISEWLIKTQKEFDRSRFGGYTLGVRSPVPVLNLTNLLVEAFDDLDQINSSLPLPFPNVTDNATTTATTTAHIKVWYNNKGWVSSVAYMNAINNVVLRASLPSNVSGEYLITTINHPMNFTSKQLGVQLIELSGVSLLHSIAVIFALSFVPASFTLYLIEEKVTNSKHLQLVSGVSRLIYWLQAYSWDMICYIVSASLCVFIFLMFNEQSYVSPTNFPGFVMLLLFYGWSCIPLMYPASFFFKVPSSAFVGLACANMFIGIITTVTTFVLSVFDDEELRAVGNILQELFLIFPHYCLGSGLMKLATSHLAKASLATYDIEVDTDIFAWTFLGKNLLCMFFIGLLFFFVTLLIELRVFKRLCASDTKNFKLSPPNQEDEDVWKERQRITEGNTQKDILIINNLSKLYSNSQSVKPAVNQICVGVKKGECFGLLGLNGAGKTSTFKMLTGATGISSGDATVDGWSIKSDIDQVRSLIGYCPQFDALDALLTPREHLELYARLRNIPSNKMNQTIDASLSRLGLGHYSDRCAGTLSGGNKRKLSTAIALLGKPHLIFLDEPTSGMDPKARRFLWSCIQDIVREGCSVILTSHSMEECQALCTRLTIMVNGQFKCLGSSQHLKNRFGKGYSLVLRCKDDSLQETVKEYIEREMPGAELIEAHYCQLHYQLAMKDMKLNTVFQCMERARQQLLLQDYSLSQTTLEEVFIRFASQQADMAKQKHGLRYYLKQVFVKNCTKCSAKDDQIDEEVTV